MLSFSSHVEPFGVAAAARSPRDPGAVAAAVVASIACSRRTPKNRPAIPQASAQARRQSHPVQAAFAAIRASDPREAARIFRPATSAQPIDNQPEPHLRTEFLHPTPLHYIPTAFEEGVISSLSAPFALGAHGLRKRPLGLGRSLPFAEGATLSRGPRFQRRRYLPSSLPAPP
jgi:hypothetical protein